MFLRVTRWIPASGIAFVLLVVVAALLTRDSPGGDTSEAEIASYYADPDNLDAERVSFFLVGLAAFCFLLFLGSLRGALARAEGDPARLTTATIAAASVFITLAVTAHVLGTGLSLGEGIYGESFAVDPNVARLMLALSYGFFVMSLFAAGAMVLAASILALHSRVFPNWLAVFGFPAALAGLISALVWPSLLVLAWILAVSVVLLLQQRPPPAAPEPPTP
jgi:hypothetical protein